MQYRLQLSVVLFAILAAVSCSDDDNPISGIKPTVTGSGVLITESRALPEFSSVIMNTMGDVYIGWPHWSTEPVSLTVDDNIMQFVTINVTNGVLIIDSDPSKQLRDFDLTVNLTMTNIESVTLAGLGTIWTTTAAHRDDPAIDVLLTGIGDIYLTTWVPEVTAVVSGVGSIWIRGRTSRIYATLSGAGKMNLFPLYTDTAVVNLSGSGEVEVSVIDLLTAAISGEGSIYYKEDPTVHETITGTGRVVHVD